ncbi:carbohydrate ABC transporter permease [Kribbella sp. NPDC004536]|uniref:carbohydrate ABC transporter permease n=1 Tax=Kribbella sp. NPDC004536 TaxID=3364106 RepID=UPI00368DCDD4
MAVIAEERSKAAVTTKKTGSKVYRPYSNWFYLPTAIIYGVLFLIPTFASLYFSLTRWSLFESKFIGLENFKLFFQEPQLVKGFTNTLIYAVVTSGSKVVLGLLLAVLLTSQIVARGYLRSVVFFPVLVSTIGVGLTFTVLMNPDQGLINKSLAAIGIQGPGWLTDPKWALLSVAAVDVWKGVGLATLIYIAGIVSIPREYIEAARVDGAGSWQQFRRIVLPLSRPATVTVIILSLIGGLRSFDLIWAMTRGGPGFTSDVIASVIYKQYQAGFYGLSTAGNVVLFVVVTAIILPLSWALNRKEVDL